jgi:AraC-like DNA-binding protein/quercetin dioxygenase-like cupin family protein
LKYSNTLFWYEKNLKRGEMQTPAADILQVAELAVAVGSEITEHIQNCDEITYVVSGKATVWSGGHVFQMSEGQIHYIKAGNYHRIVADRDENFRYCCIGFLPRTDYKEISGFLEAVSDRSDFLIEDEGNVKTLFPLLIDEFHIRDSESNAMIHFYFCQMLIQIYRILSGGFREKLSRLDTSASNNAVYLALKYIDREYPNLTRTKEVAEAISYSEYYLSHIFKERMGVTIKEYLMRKKIKMAVELLKTSSMTVTEIAQTLSFTSLHSFNTAFKRYMGISPSELRRSAKQSE